MAEVLLNAKYWVGGLDLSGHHNQHALVVEADAPEVTAFGDGTRVYLGGLKGAGSEHSGFFDEPVDNALFSAIAAAARNVTLAPDGAVGDVAFLFRSLGTSYAPGGSVGDAYAFSASDQVSGPVTRGVIAVNGTVLDDGAGTAIQLGAVPSGQVLRASLHVLDLQGAAPTLDVDVASDDNQGFASGIVRASFAQATAEVGEIVELAGPVSDTWWRVQWVTGAQTTSATLVVAFGIGEA